MLIHNKTLVTNVSFITYCMLDSMKQLNVCKPVTSEKNLIKTVIKYAYSKN